MASEAKSKETRNADATISQEQWPSKDIKEKEAVGFGNGNGESKKAGEPKTGEVMKEKQIHGESKTGEVAEGKQVQGEPKTGADVEKKEIQGEPKLGVGVEKKELHGEFKTVAVEEKEEIKGAPETGVAAEEKQILGEPKTGMAAVGEGKSKEDESPELSQPSVEKTASFREESNLQADLKDVEKNALAELKSKLEGAILWNQLFVKEDQAEELEKAKSAAEESEKSDKQVPEGDEKEKPVAEEGKEDEKSVKGENEEKEKAKPEGKEKEKNTDEGSETKTVPVVLDEKVAEVDKDIAIWGVPLLPSKADEAIDVILLKFLRAREFKVNEAFEMLKKTLQWRKENNIATILDEEFGTDLASAAYMNGVDRDGHPVCYNIYGVLENDAIYDNIFGTQEKRERFLRWRFQLMEKGIQKLDFKPGGVSSLLQINDLKNTPGPTKKELRLATKQAVDLLQDNYPEFVARNIFINVPFWYYAFNALLSPFLTQRTKSKFVFARPAKVTETLLKYIAAEEIPVSYGGLKRENDSDFSAQDATSEVAVKAGTTETIEIPTPEAGTISVWDLTVLGWEVNYKEEFVPTDEGSYTVIIQKGKKMAWQEAPIRNSFRSNEPGKVVLTIENGTFKKKRILYRHKIKSSSS